MTRDAESNPADDLDAKLIYRLRRRLLNWYDKHQRDLPWRAKAGYSGKAGRAANPYHVLVSEAMLQQTQVATVIDYFTRFIDALPTVRALADADEQHVLTLWQGLGYYRRARNLHAAARQVVDEHDGQVPDTVEALLALPGIGRYTAGAIASIAYDVSAPILDGNVARVLARWFAIDEPIDENVTREQLWALADRLVPNKRAGDFNQALMELGALVCTPKSPKCLICAMKPTCDAHERGLADRLPKRLPRRKPQAVVHHVLVLEKAGRFLFQQRPAKGLWSNMWQMPTVESLNGSKSFNKRTTKKNVDESLDVLSGALTQWCKSTIGLDAKSISAAVSFEHQTTHRRITFQVWRCTKITGRLKRGAGQWRRLNEIDDLPLPNPQRKIVEDVQTRDIS